MEYQLIQREGRTAEALLCATSRLSALEAMFGKYEVLGSIEGKYGCVDGVFQ